MSADVALEILRHIIQSLRNIAAPARASLLYDIAQRQAGNEIFIGQ